MESKKKIHRIVEDIYWLTKNKKNINKYFLMSLKKNNRI